MYGGTTTTTRLKLKIVSEQQIQVNTAGLSVDTSADNNATAMVIKGKDLDALSDDPDQLQNDLNALAGPSAGPNGSQFTSMDLQVASLGMAALRFLPSLGRISFRGRSW